MPKRAVIAFSTIQDCDWQSATISSARMEKTKSYRFEDDKKRCALSEVVLRKALASFGVNPKEILYTFNEHGKPYLKNYEDVYFSISHSKDYVVSIVSDCEIGIDIEHIEDINLDIAKRFFSEPEYNAILSAGNNQQQLEKFYDCWTKKEAYIKWLGKGLACSLKSFNVYDKLDCKFITIDGFADYKCSICTKNTIDNLEILR